MNDRFSSKNHPQQRQTYLLKTKRIALTILLVGAILSGSAFAQGDSLLSVRNPKNKNFPTAEATRIYESACLVVAREVRPEHPPLLQPRFTLVLGSDRDELVQHNLNAELHLKSWDREKFAQGVIVLAVREILKNDAVPKLSRRALAWTDAVVPMPELAEAK
ncbi:MAG: hypothetical protein L0Z53_03680 [Acidobacteriales bacterium]|nr:hypothetical protein [Terriglobales bacterium]